VEDVLNCRCMDADLEMARLSITYGHVKGAADENARSVVETLDILEHTGAKDRGEHAVEYATPAKT
jgi:hypothetical protein